MTTDEAPAVRPAVAVRSQIPPHRPLRSLFGVLLAAVVALASWSLTSRLLEADPVATGTGPLDSIDQSTFAGDTGVWIEHVSFMAGGGLIEIRYRILDVDKSEIVHDVEFPPRVLAADGFELRFQRHAHGHSRENRLGATYSEQLVNVGSYLSRGDVVTVMIGNFALEGIPVL